MRSDGSVWSRIFRRNRSELWIWSLRNEYVEVWSGLKQGLSSWTDANRKLALELTLVWTKGITLGDLQFDFCLNLESPRSTNSSLAWKFTKTARTFLKVNSTIVNFDAQTTPSFPVKLEVALGNSRKFNIRRSESQISHSISQRKRSRSRFPFATGEQRNFRFRKKLPILACCPPIREIPRHRWFPISSSSNVFAASSGSLETILDENPAFACYRPVKRDISFLVGIRAPELNTHSLPWVLRLNSSRQSEARSTRTPEFVPAHLIRPIDAPFFALGQDAYQILSVYQISFYQRHDLFLDRTECWPNTTQSQILLSQIIIIK